jgi:hypothetical protein
MIGGAVGTTQRSSACGRLVTPLTIAKDARVVNQDASCAGNPSVLSVEVRTAPVQRCAGHVEVIGTMGGELVLLDQSAGLGDLAVKKVGRRPRGSRPSSRRSALESLTRSRVLVSSI